MKKRGACVSQALIGNLVDCQLQTDREVEKRDDTSQGAGKEELDSC